MTYPTPDEVTSFISDLVLTERANQCIDAAWKQSNTDSDSHAVVPNTRIWFGCIAKAIREAEEAATLLERERIKQHLRDTAKLLRGNKWSDDSDQAMILETAADEL